MLRTLATAITCCVALGSAGHAAEGFQLRTTADLARVCAPAPGDPMAAEALQFCHGFIMGNGLFYRELIRADQIAPIACAEPPPTLAEIRDAFVDWAAIHGEYMDASPVDGFWRAMAARWPCA